MSRDPRLSEVLKHVDALRELGVLHLTINENGIANWAFNWDLTDEECDMLKDYWASRSGAKGEASMKLLATVSAFVLAFVLGFPIFAPFMLHNLSLATTTLVILMHFATIAAFTGLVYGVLGVIERKDKP